MTALLKCSKCSKEFKYDSERRRHEQSHYPQFQCKVCSKNFSFVSALRRHEKQHERTSAVTCNECGREFRDDMLLKRHMNYAHGGSHTCTKCETIFNSEAALRTHMNTHKSASERRFQCRFEGCNKKFNFAHHLKHHELTHTNSKQHYCKVCGKGFIQSHHLKAHLRTHSPDASLYCTFPDCNKKFATSYAKKRHINKYHIKTDSDISSDSNSTHDPSLFKVSSILNDDNIQSDLITKIEHDLHPSIFGSSDLVEDIAEDLSIPKDYKNTPVETAIIDIDNEVNDCQLALGRCIMRDEGEKCVCEQIKNANNYVFTPTETITNNNISEKTNDCKTRDCCGGTCGDRKEKFPPNDDIPEMVYKSDGTVKIKEFLDEALMPREMEYKTDHSKVNGFLGDGVPKVDKVQKYSRDASNDGKFVPFNSCKAVLGNCIVSGNGTIGEGCLCAKMIIDDQVTAQEIEDITPYPKGQLPLTI